MSNDKKEEVLKAEDIKEVDKNQDKKEKDSKKVSIKDRIKGNKFIKPIAIATFLTMLLVMFVGNVYKNGILRILYGTNGIYNAEVVVTDKQYNKLKKNKAVEDIGYIDVAKYVLCNGAPYNDSRAYASGVRVGSLNKKVLDLYYVELSKGRMPRNKKEIILSEYYDITRTIEVGEWITLEKGKRSATYKVVGKYVDGIRTYQYDEQEKLNDEYNALTYDPYVKEKDSRVAYVSFYSNKIKGTYDEIRSMGIKGDNIHINDAVEEGINKEILHTFGVFHIYVLILVAVVVLMTVLIYAILRVRFGKLISHYIEGKEDTENIKSIVKTEVNNVIWLGMALGVIGYIIINPIYNTSLGRLIYEKILCVSNALYGANIWYTVIGVLYALLIIVLAQKNAARKLVDKTVLTTKEISGKKLKRSIVFSAVLIIITIFATYKVKPMVVKTIEPFEKEKTYDIRITEYVENLGVNQEEIKKEYSDRVKQSYNKFKADMTNIGVDSVTSLVVHQDTQIRISKAECSAEYYIDSKDEFGLHKTPYIERDLNKIYIEDNLYKELLKQYNLDEKKYIGVKNTPAIILNKNYSPINDKTFNIFKESVKQLRSLVITYTLDGVDISVGDNILVGDYINENAEFLQIDISGDIGAGICAIYPESAMNNITYYILDIEVKDYAQIEDKLNKWAEENDINLVDETDNEGIFIDAPIAKHRYKVRENEERQKTMYIAVGSIILLAVLNVVIAVVRNVIESRKKRN